MREEGLYISKGFVNCARSSMWNSITELRFESSSRGYWFNQKMLGLTSSLLFRRLISMFNFHTLPVSTSVNSSVRLGLIVELCRLIDVRTFVWESDGIRTCEGDLRYAGGHGPDTYWSLLLMIQSFSCSLRSSLPNFIGGRIFVDWQLVGALRVFVRSIFLTLL